MISVTLEVTAEGWVWHVWQDDAQVGKYAARRRDTHGFTLDELELQLDDERLREALDSGHPMEVCQALAAYEAA